MGPLTFLALCAAIGCGLIAGVFFAFSTFVMSALARLEPARGIEAMQWINRTVINPWFLGVFLGTAALCPVLVGVTLLGDAAQGSFFLMLGCALYFVGTFGVTIARNVPMNDALAAVKPEETSAAEEWARYLAGWTRWNHVRTVAAVLGAASLTIAIWRQGGSLS